MVEGKKQNSILSVHTSDHQSLNIKRIILVKLSAIFANNRGFSLSKPSLMRCFKLSGFVEGV